MARQVYADNVDANGKVFETVGENIRNGARAGELLKFQEITDKIDALDTEISTLQADVTDNKSGIKKNSDDIDSLKEDLVDINNWYKNKKLTTLGDSITEQNLWQSFLKQELLFSSIVNKGIGGTRISGTNGNAMWQNNRINALPLDTDVLTIMGGTNDSASSVNIGDISITNHDTNTFVGAYNVLISKVLYKFYNLSSGKYSDINYSGLIKSVTFKDIVIYIMTPPFNANTQYSGENSTRLKAISDATKEVAKMWGIPCIDIYYNSGINTENVNALLQDGINPNNLGAKKIASVVVNEMKSHAPIK
jgi:lysophospholipase L1-like esterase